MGTACLSKQGTLFVCMCTGTGCRDDSGSGRLCAVAFCSTVERAGAGTAVICNISCVCYNMDGVVCKNSIQRRRISRIWNCNNGNCCDHVSGILGCGSLYSGHALPEISDSGWRLCVVMDTHISLVKLFTSLFIYVIV